MCLLPRVPQTNALRLMDRKKNQTEKYWRRGEKGKARVHWIFYAVNFTFTIINSGFVPD